MSQSFVVEKNSRSVKAKKRLKRPRITMHQLLVTANDIHPLPRSGHRAVADSANFYVVGGYVEHKNKQMLVQGEIWRYNFFNEKWRKLVFDQELFKLAASPSALLFDQYIIVHGGTGNDFGKDIDNSLIVFDLNKLITYNLPHRFKDGNQDHEPVPTYGHSLTMVRQESGTYLYKFGGARGALYIPCMFRYNMCEGYWEQMTDGLEEDAIEPRYRHDAFYYNNKIHIIGGANRLVAHPFSPMPAYCVNTNKWSHLSFKGVKPLALRFQSSSQDGKNIYVSGGVCFEQAFKNPDIYCFDLENLMCVKLFHNPIPTYFHDTAYVPEHQKLYSFGGVVEINPVKRTNDFHQFTFKNHPKSLCELSWSAVGSVLKNISKSCKSITALDKTEFQQYINRELKLNLANLIGAAMCLYDMVKPFYEAEIRASQVSGNGFEVTIDLDEDPDDSDASLQDDGDVVEAEFAYMPQLSGSDSNDSDVSESGDNESQESLDTDVRSVIRRIFYEDSHLSGSSWIRSSGRLRSSIPCPSEDQSDELLHISLGFCLGIPDCYLKRIENSGRTLPLIRQCLDNITQCHNGA